MEKNSYSEYHLKQYVEMYRSTHSLINFLKERIPNKRFDILDVGCGGGANIHWMKKSFPEWEFTGIDTDKEALTIAREKHKGKDGVRFEEIDLTESEQHFSPKTFDYISAVQFISFVEFDFPLFLEKAFGLAKKGVFLTSLFSEGWIEQHTKAYDLKEQWEGIYKVYSLERFIKIAKEIGGEGIQVEYEPFHIDIDLPKPAQPTFRTYTETMQDGRRLQISAHMLMPWYNVFVKIA